MPYTRTFVWREDHDLGAGWIMHGMPHFDPSAGLGVAHDVLEHFDYGAGLEHELQAFGAILWGRALGGYRHMLGSPVNWSEAENLVEDLGRFLSEHHLVVPPCRAQRLRDEDEGEDILAEIGRRLPTAVLDQWECFNWKRPEEGGTLPPERVESQTRDCRDDVLNWMRVGFRRATRRWGQHASPYTFACLFNALRIKVDALRHPYDDTFHEGDKLIVSVSPRRMDFTLRVQPYLDPYAY